MAHLQSLPILAGVAGRPLVLAGGYAGCAKRGDPPRLAELHFAESIGDHLIPFELAPSYTLLLNHPYYKYNALACSVSLERRQLTALLVNLT